MSEGTGSVVDCGKRLDVIAEELGDKQRKLKGMANEMLGVCREVGLLLLEAKERCDATRFDPSAQTVFWGDWVRDCCPFGRRYSYLLMDVATHWKVVEECCLQKVGGCEVTVREAVRVIRGAKRSGSGDDGGRVQVGFESLSATSNEIEMMDDGGFNDEEAVVCGEDCVEDYQVVVGRLADVIFKKNGVRSKHQAQAVFHRFIAVFWLLSPAKFDGQSIRDLSDLLGVSHNTIDKHVIKLKKAFGV